VGSERDEADGKRPVALRPQIRKHRIELVAEEAGQASKHGSLVAPPGQPKIRQILQ
jgi:hypothetical protein